MEKGGRVYSHLERRGEFQLRSNIPMVLYCLPEDVKEQIMAFIKKNYTVCDFCKQLKV